MKTCNDCANYIYTDKGGCKLFPFEPIESYNTACEEFVKVKEEEIIGSTRVNFKDGTYVEYSDESTVRCDKYTNTLYVVNANGTAEISLDEVANVEFL